MKKNLVVVLVRSMFLVFVIAFSACDRDEIEPEVQNFGYEYYPLKNGSERTYHIRRIDYNPTGLDSTITDYELQERITEKFIDESGNDAYRVERYRRADSTGIWTLDSIAVAYRTDTRAVRNLTNTPIVKLTFPLKLGQKWNGNQLNSLQSEAYEVLSLDRPFVLIDTVWQHSQQFEQTAFIMNNDQADPVVSSDVRFERYAKGVGLIYREERIFTYWQTYENQVVIGDGKIQSGHKYYQSLINYTP